MKNAIFGIVAALTFGGVALGLTKITGAETELIPVTPVTPPTSEAGHATGGVMAKMDNETVKLNFNAHQNPVKGVVSFTDSAGVKIMGDVDTCYSQSGDTAVFAGAIDKGGTGYFKVQVEDNGEGKNASPDMLNVWTSNDPLTCDMGAVTWEVFRGNLQVHSQ